MKPVSEPGAAGALCIVGAGFDVLIVLASLVDLPRGAVDVPRIEVPRPDSVNCQSAPRVYLWYLLRRVNSHYPSLFSPSCPLAILGRGLRLGNSLGRMEHLDCVPEVRMDGLLPYCLGRDSWEES